MAERMGFGQVDANNRVIPRWEQGQRQTQPPQAQAPSPSPYDTVLQVLQDPRNAWIGMSPLGMATRAPGIAGRAMEILRSERGSFNPFGWGKAESAGPNLGGFAPSVEQMRSASKDIIQNGRDMRQAYIDHIIGMNHYVDNFQANNPLQVQELMRLELNRPQLANDINATAMGKMDLQKEVGKAFDPAMESNPPTQVRRLFGLK